MDEMLLREREFTNGLVQTNTEKWIEYGFLTPQWWLLLAFLIVPWMIWIKMVDRKRILEILLIGSLVIITTTLLDVFGYYLNFWVYPIELVPLLPGALPFDLSMIPVPYMLLYQFCRTWKSYCIGLLCMAILYAFIGEPISIWLKLVIYFKWSYIYSFVYYILTGIFVREFVETLIRTRPMISKV